MDDRASHPCGVLAGQPFSVFAKLSTAVDARQQFTGELAGLQFLARSAPIRTPTAIGAGVLAVPTGAVLAFEALAERLPGVRERSDWSAIGHTLAELHLVTREQFGRPGPAGWFGPFRQDDRPVPSNRWVDFYRERRLTPRLRSAVDSGHLPAELAGGVERIIDRLPALAGPEPKPALLHGDAQQNNFVSTASGAVVVDASPYFGHPEIDLALLDYFEPVPTDVFDAYRELASIEPGFAERRELWRLFGYLAVIAVDGGSEFGRRYLGRIGQIVDGLG